MTEKVNNRRVRCNNCDSIFDEDRISTRLNDAGGEDSEWCPVCKAEGTIGDVETFVFKDLSTDSPRKKALEWFKENTGDYDGITDDEIEKDLVEFGSDEDDYKFYSDGSPVPEEAR